MTRRVLMGFLTVILFALVVLSVPLGSMFADRERERLLAFVVSDAQEIAGSVDGWLLGTGRVDGSEVVERYERERDGRVVVTDRDGIAVADSRDGSSAAADFSTRPEVLAALDGEVASGVRRSDTLGADLAFVAVPVSFDGVVIGVVRITYPASRINDRIHDMWWRLGSLGAVVMAAAGAVGWLIARGVTRPVSALADAARRIGDGERGVRAGVEHAPPEIRDLGESFDDMAARLDNMLETQRAFIADASLQLRTPLTALRLRLDALVDSGADESEVAAAQNEAERLSRLADALLGVARLDADSVAAATVDLAEEIAARVAMWAPLMAENDVAVDLSIDTPPGLAVSCPRDGLAQVLDNLFSNALDAVESGGCIEVSTVRRGTTVELAVADDGAGMAPELMERAFERFWRAPGAGPGGTGLGLAVVERVARASGGSATIAARDGGGVVVTLRLPVAEVAGPVSSSRAARE